MAVTFDAASSTGAGGSGGPTYSWTHTPVGTPTAVGLWATIYGGGNTISGVTYGGVSMGAPVLTVTNTGGRNDTDYLFGLASPLSGPQTIIVTTAPAGGKYIICGAMTVLGSDTTTCFRNTASSTPAASPH